MLFETFKKYVTAPGIAMNEIDKDWAWVTAAINIQILKVCILLYIRYFWTRDITYLHIFKSKIQKKILTIRMMVIITSMMLIFYRIYKRRPIIRVLLFSHVNQQQSIFCVIRLEMGTKAAVTANIPFDSYQRSHIYVTDIAHLDCLTMQLPSLHVKNKNYYIDPGMMKHMFLNTRI